MLQCSTHNNMIVKNIKCLFLQDYIQMEKVETNCISFLRLL